MKKFGAFMLALILAMSLSVSAFAADNNDSPSDIPQNATVTTFVGDDGLVYEYIQYAEPVSYAYDGTTHTLLGVLRRQENKSAIMTRDYRDWKEWKVIDNGIEQSWVFMSKPYFVKSIARGETYQKSVEKAVSISPKAGISIPAGCQPTVNKALKGEFSLSLTGSYKKTITITLSGPDDDSSNNTRTFYYKLGYHKHNLTIIETLRSNWDGVIKETTHKNCYGYEPAVKSYSEDSKA